MAESPDLVAKLQASDPEVQAYVVALKAQMTKLQKRMLDVEAENVMLQCRIDAIKSGYSDPLPTRSDEELMTQLRDAITKMGYDLVKRAS